MDDEPGTIEAQQETRCAECGTILVDGQDREQTDDGSFCRPCFNNLTEQLRQVVAVQGQDVNYSMALIGGLAGAALGVLVWWGFTAVTQISLGLVAIVIGVAVGKGVVILSGHKRGVKLQIMSVAISIAGFFYASYLVNRTFIQQAYSEQGQDLVLPWVPDPRLLFEVLKAGFGVMDLVFLAIVIYEAYRIPAPMELSA